MSVLKIKSFGKEIHSQPWSHSSSAPVLLLRQGFTLCSRVASNPQPFSQLSFPSAAPTALTWERAFLHGSECCCCSTSSAWCISAIFVHFTSLTSIIHVVLLNCASVSLRLSAPIFPSMDYGWVQVRATKRNLIEDLKANVHVLLLLKESHGQAWKQNDTFSSFQLLSRSLWCSVPNYWIC